MAVEERAALCVADEMIRISVGTETIEDIKRDIQQSFDSSPAVQKELK
jgi:O-acetylhomoserine/O-acetylserine sulfhydrylase-like pyridoxal-dependent enzyme